MTRRPLASLLAVVAAGAMGIALIGARARRVDVAPGDRLLLADVAGAATTGDTTLGAALLAAATTALERSLAVPLHPRQRLPAVYRLMRIDAPDTALTYELAREVAERDGARFVLGLWVDRDAAGYRVTARVADVRAGREVGEARASAASPNELVSALGDALAEVTRRLGAAAGVPNGSTSDASIADAPLPEVTTASLEALRAYAGGTRAWASADYPRARELWRRAVDLDTGFAMAFGALGGSHYYTHDRAEGERYFQAALARAGRLTPLEALRLREQRARFRGDVDSAVALSAVIAARYPSGQAWSVHGRNLMRRGRNAEAIDALRRAVALDPTDASAWINLATTYGRLSRHDDAVRAYERAGAADSAALARGNVAVEFGGTLVRLGRVAAAESVFRHLATAPTLADRALGHRSLGYLAAWRGRYDDAIAAYRQAVATTQQMQSWLSEGRNRLLLAGALRTAGRTAEADAEVTRTLALAASPAFEPVMLALLAYACHDHRRPSDARAVAAMVRARVDSVNPSDRASVALVDAVVHLGRNRPDSALVALRRAEAYPFAIPRRVLTATALEAIGRVDSARTVWSWVIDEKPFGYEGQEDALRARLRLGDLLAQARDSAGAVRHYRALLSQWHDAPRDVPDLVAARGRLRALGAVP